MSRLIGAAIERRKITLFLVAILAVYGVYSYYIIPKQESPDVSVPVALLVTVYPGASPNDVEKLVTAKLEEATSRISGFDHHLSFSHDSVSVLGVRLRQGADIDRAWYELRTTVNDTQELLPDGCWKPIITTDLAETAGMIISLSGDKYTSEQLVAFAEEFTRGLGAVDGISRFDIRGEIEKEVIVETEIEKLNQYQLSLEDLFRILRAQNVEIPSGRIEKGAFSINVSTPGIFTSLKDIENVIIHVSSESGAPVRLKNIAKVYMAERKSAYKVRQDGRGAVLLTGYFEADKNIVLVGKEVRKKIEQVKNRLPGDLVIEEVTFQPTDVETAVSGFMNNLLQGVLLVILVIFFGMGLRNAIIVSTAIPISVLMTFSAMNLLDIKVHQVSIAALIIALGMLVDNAIVIADAVQVRVDSGMKKGRAAFEGAVESAVPILTSTLTTVAAFSPLAFLPGLAGEFLGSLPAIVIIALMSSYLVAMFVTPAMAAIFFKMPTWVSRREGFFRKRFFGFLRYGLYNRKKVIFLALLALGFSFWLTGFLSLRFFPYADKNLLYIDLRSEAVDLKKTEAFAIKVEEILARQKEVTRFTTAIGDGLPKFYITTPTAFQAKDFAQIVFEVDLKKGGRFDNNEAFALALQKQLDLTLSMGRATVNLLQQGEPMRAPVLVRVGGDDLALIEGAVRRLQAAIETTPGATNVNNDASPRKYEMVVDVVHDVASSMGISKYDIQRQINIALYGSRSSVYRKGGNEFDIIVRSNIDSKETLENLAIKSRAVGNKVLLKQFAQIKLRPQLENILHYRGERSIAVTAHVQQGYSATEVEDTIEREVVPKIDLGGVNIGYDGERERIRKNFGNIGMSAVFALFAIYMILLIQFNSFAQPFVILMTVPLSVIGSILGLWLTDQPLSFTATLGIASLVGIVVNNAILLIEFINMARRDGESIDVACVEAVRKRFRPIMLSTITTVMGLTPLAFAKNPMFTPMAVSLLSGLIVSTLLTLVIIPVVYRTVVRD